MGKEKYTGNWPDWIRFTGEIIAENARQCAWPSGTPKKKRTYVNSDKIYGENPHRYGKYGEMLDKAFPNRYPGWGKQPAAGASCDVFASTMVVSTGYDKKVPRGLGGRGKGQYKHFAESPLWENCKAYKASQRRPGDYILYLNKDKGGHAGISGGTKITYEAGYLSKRYGCTVKASNYSPSSKAILGIYRPTKALRKFVQEKDRGDTVKRVQSFLNWAGFSVDTADGIAGPKTTKAIKAFQLAAGLVVDGKFGEKCVEAGQQWTIETKNTYPGKLPTKTLKRGIKNKTEVIYLQNFLNWYDDYELIRDGIFGSLVEKAVKDFQKQEGLVIDGIFGPACRAKAKIVEK